MTVGLWCLFIAIFIPYFFAAYAKFSGPGYDNSRPRDFLEALEGKRKRAHWSQLNTFEAIPAFAAAIIIAHYLKANQTTIDILAIIFVISRILYGVFYIQDKKNMRTLVWFVAFICIISLFIISA